LGSCKVGAFSTQLTPPGNLPKVSAVDERHTFMDDST
jgi:hypothetical protein